MMRILLAMMLLAIIPAHAGEFWSSLWRNADQQGEALLQRGDASNAAKVYADPRRKAYAKLKAGDYQGAAKDLGECTTATPTTTAAMHWRMRATCRARWTPTMPR